MPGYRKTIFFFAMKLSFLLLLFGCFLGVTAKTTQTDINKRGVVADNGKIVLHQVCNSERGNAEISSLKKVVEMLKERWDKNEAKGKGATCWLIYL